MIKTAIFSVNIGIFPCYNMNIIINLHTSTIVGNLLIKMVKMVNANRTTGGIDVTPP